MRLDPIPFTISPVFTISPFHQFTFPPSSSFHCPGEAIPYCLESMDFGTEIDGSQDFFQVIHPVLFLITWKSLIVQARYFCSVKESVIANPMPHRPEAPDVLPMTCHNFLVQNQDLRCIILMSILKNFEILITNMQSLNALNPNSNIWAFE